MRIANFLMSKLASLLAYFSPLPLAKFPEWKREIVYPSQALMCGGIRLVDPFQGDDSAARWIDGRGRYA